MGPISALAAVMPPHHMTQTQPTTGITMVPKGPEVAPADPRLSGHANAEAALLTAAQAAAAGLTARLTAGLMIPTETDAAPDVPLTALQAAHAAIPKGPAPAHVPLAGYEPEDKLDLTEKQPDPQATAPWLLALQVIRSA